MTSRLQEKPLALQKEHPANAKVATVLGSIPAFSVPVEAVLNKMLSKSKKSPYFDICAHADTLYPVMTCCKFLKILRRLCGEGKWQR
jgi:hypothetical protein